MDARVTVRDHWEARLAWQCGVRQIDLRLVERERSGTPALETVRAVSRAAPDVPLSVSLLEGASSSAATGLMVAGASSGGATHVVVDVASCPTPADAVRLLAAAVRAGGDAGVTTAARFSVDGGHAGTSLLQLLAEVPDIAAAAGCSGVVVETARKGARGVTSTCGLAVVAGLARRCHDRGLTCVVGGGVRFDEFPGLRGTEVDAVAVRTVVTTGARRISRLDPGMLCLAVAHAAGAPLFLS